MNHQWMAIVVGALSVAIPAANAWACSPPPMVEQIVGTIPKKDATNVSTNAPIALQIYRFNDWAWDYNSETSFEYGFTINVMTAAGELIATHVREESDLWNDNPRWQVLTFDPGALQPETTYVVEVANDRNRLDWSFTTGSGSNPTAATGALTASIQPGWGSYRVYRCCETEFVGQCPDCYTVGSDPIPRVEATFDLLDHELGPAGWVYALQASRSTGSWEDVQVGVDTYDEQPIGSLTYERNDLAGQEICYRVVARGAIGEARMVAGNEVCLTPEAYPTRPDAVRDSTPLHCDVDVDEDVTTDQEDTDPDDPRRPNDPNNPRDRGWKLSEGFGKSGENGCCATAPASTPSSPFAAALLGLSAILVARRRRLV